MKMPQAGLTYSVFVSSRKIHQFRVVSSSIKFNKVHVRVPQHDVADMGDVERNENAICVYPRVQYCMCESCWRRFTHVLIDRACAYSCNGLRTPSSSPLSIVILSPFNLYFSTLIYFCSAFLSVFFAMYMPLYLLAPLSLSLILCSSILVGHSVLLYLIVSILNLCLSLEVNSPFHSSFISLYIMILVIFSVCVSFCKRLHLSFPLEDFTTCIYSVCAHNITTYCHVRSSSKFLMTSNRKFNTFYRTNESKIFIFYILYFLFIAILEIFELILNYIFIPLIL